MQQIFWKFCVCSPTSRFSSVTLREVALPSIVVEIAPVQLDIKYMQDEAKMLNYKSVMFITLLSMSDMSTVLV